MSDFKTTIPVDISAVTKLLPPGSDLLGKPTFDPEAGQVTIHWHNKDLLTPYTFEVDYPIELLRDGKTP